MQDQFALVPFHTVSPIDPEHIRVDLKNPGWVQVRGTLERIEYEEIALDFIVASKEAHTWTGVCFPVRVNAFSNYAEMVQYGMLSEKKTESGWIYALTPTAIAKVYVVQAEEVIRFQSRELKKVHNESFFQFLRRMLTTKARLA